MTKHPVFHTNQKIAMTGQRQKILSNFVLNGSQVGSYDVARPLIIDPVLTYSTFLSNSACG